VRASDASHARSSSLVRGIASSHGRSAAIDCRCVRVLACNSSRLYSAVNWSRVVSADSVLALFSTAKSATLCISVGSTLLVHQIYPCFDSRDHCPFDLDCKLNGSSSWLAHEMTILPHVPLHPPVHGPSQLPNSCVILCPRCARRNAPPRSIIDGLRTSAGMAKRGGGRRRAR